MQQLDGKDLEFLARFNRTPDGLFFVALLNRELAANDLLLRKITGEELLRTQGRAQLLAELIAAVAEADKKAKLATRQPSSRAATLDAGKL